MTVGDSSETHRTNNIGLNILSDEDIRKIDGATRDVLSNYGVRVPNEEALNVFEKAGAEVDRETNMVRIPAWLVDKALADAPSEFELYGREESRKIIQKPHGRVHHTCTGTCIQISKYLGNGKFETVSTTDAYLADCARVLDWTKNLDFFSLAVSARDWTGKGAEDVHELLTALKNTTKHVHHIDAVGGHTKYYWDIAKAFYNGDEALARKKPIISMMVCPMSPLELNWNTAQVLMEGARYGIPVSTMSVSMSGASSPIHLAGALVTQNAEILACIVLSQITVPGSRIWYGCSTTVFDMKSGTAPLGAPETGLISAAATKLGQYYNLPTFVAGTCSDSKVPDAQAAHEKTLTSILPVLTGASTVCGSGLLEFGLTFSLEQLIIDDDIISMEKTVLDGIRVDDETLSAESIKEVGVGNDFLGYRSTIEYFEQTSNPGVFDRSTAGGWRNRGSKTTTDVAHDIVVDILKNHKVAPIAADQLEKMEAVVRRADEDFLRG
ncbi:MAG: [trimethylamine--corrinoid protein] Co-methyltransferase [Candidatus Methanoplasma sp.]|jgi:trimethylamine--corrinoid protein Co-methyltransferase|nr:[trimethylamine--corrinoid protein] Co-methyltransferase [Candidatus Methanoplasma sp.]